MAVVGNTPYQCFSSVENQITSPDNFFNRAAFALYETATGNDDERLPQRMACHAVCAPNSDEVAAL